MSDVMSLGTRLFTFLRGELVGGDAAGNCYYREKAGDHDDGHRRKRWVLYAGAPEASAVPPEWHAWLHRITDKPPSESPLPIQPWEKPHEANATGTDAAYVPAGSLLAGGVRPKATGDYEPWRP
jgi:NADH:ubiquinone oxidoreductase subunit